MPDITRIFREMPDRFRKGQLDKARSYYFSIGDDKYTVQVDAETCTVEEGRTLDQCDVVLKTTPELFERMVIKGKMPGPLDIARGRIKTNDPAALANLKNLFDL